MEIRHFVRVLRGHWLFIVASFAVCVGLAAALAWTRAPVYSAQTQLFISSNGGSADPAATYQGGLFAEERVLSYAQVISSPAVLNPVIRRLGLHETSQQLAAKIQTGVPTNTVLLNVTVQDRSARRAQAIASTLARQFVGFVRVLEAPGGGGGSPVKVSITNPAQLPTSPSSPRKLEYLAIGVVLGLLVGIGGAVGLEAFDRRVRDDRDALEAAGAGVLVTVSERRGGKPKAPIVLTKPFSARAEAYRRLGVNLAALVDDRGLRSFMISSASRDESQAVVAANLGIVLAKAGYRTALVDANLSSPRLAAILGLSAPTGLTDVVLRGAPLASVLSTWSVGARLVVLSAGSEPSNPGDVLASRRFSGIVEELRGQFDVIIVTAPPLLEASDAAVVARVTAGAIVVARPGSTRFDDLAAAAETLRGVNATLLGVVLNGRRPKHRGGGWVAARQPQAGPGAAAPPEGGRLLGPVGPSADSAV
jgi:polysaccharide biosynthesis transport protein